jgi:hypothetical protein|tara:strand:+ start:1953 stop:2183 length:231 start_codon:yes stop_codon:yes gene_type:complete
MTYLDPNYYIAVEKALRVIQSCENMIQLNHAKTYVDLVKNRFSSLFIDNNKRVLKEYKQLKSYLKIQTVVINNKNL